jgi:heat shock protein HslJ
MKRGTNAKHAAVALIATAVLAACGTAAGQSDVDGADSDAPVTGVRWVPESVTVDGKAYDLPPGTGSYVEFKPGRKEGAGGDSGGRMGCNHFGVDVAVEGDTIKISDMVSTAMGCGMKGVQEFEARWSQVFTGDLTAKVSDNGKTLTLTADDGDRVTLATEGNK